MCCVYEFMVIMMRMKIFRWFELIIAKLPKKNYFRLKITTYKKIIISHRIKKYNYWLLKASFKCMFRYQLATLDFLRSVLSSYIDR